jgi:hypothetical protein
MRVVYRTGRVLVGICALLLYLLAARTVHVSVWPEGCVVIEPWFAAAITLVLLVIGYFSTRMFLFCHRQLRVSTTSESHAEQNLTRRCS